MKGLGIVTVALLGAALASPASAHPAPFSYIDVHVEHRVLEVTLIAHVFDIAHDLGIAQSERLLEATVLRERAADYIALIDQRLGIAVDGQPHTLTGGWDPPEALADRQSVRLHGRVPLTTAPGTVRFSAYLFPYDPQHQTFVNFYEYNVLQSQTMLDDGRTTFEYVGQGAAGIWTMVRRFLTQGISHILTGPDHLIFLVGLMLLGGSFWQLLIVASAFAVAQTITLSLAVGGVLSPQPRLIEPAIALSIIYVGVDNLLVRDGRDMRAWIALAFGLIHGFAFAGTLRALSLHGAVLGWTIASFSVGVEIGQLVAVVAVMSLLAAIKSRSEWASRQLAVAGSVFVMAAGTFWFIQRVFFTGGIS